MESYPKAKKVLIVDDDDDLRNTLVSFLKKNGFEVIGAMDGENAKELIRVEYPDLILSDIRMPNVSGIELLNYVKKTRPIPFILMTGFSDAMEAKEAFKIGADSFLAKPFTTQELFKVVSGIMANPALINMRGPSLDSDFCRVPIEDFTAGTKLQVDIYIRLSEYKYLKVAKNGSDTPVEQLRQYKSKGLLHFYIEKREFAQYVGLNVSVAKFLAGSEELSQEKKMRALRHTAEAHLQECFVNGLDRGKFEINKELINLVLDVMGKDKDLSKLLEILNSESDYLYSHGLGVAIYASLMADEMGIGSTNIKLKIAMGGLLHDIGEKEIDRSILERQRKNLTRDELKAFETHATRGSEILSQIPVIPSDVVMIALQHHEKCNGTGYPSFLKKDHIHPLARLISVADRFCELTLKSHQSPPLAPFEALDKMLSFGEKEYDLGCLCALLKIFGHPRGLEIENKYFKKPVKVRFG